MGKRNYGATYKRRPLGEGSGLRRVFEGPLMSEFSDYGFKDVIAKPCEVKGLAEVLKMVINEE